MIFLEIFRRNLLVTRDIYRFTNKQNIKHKKLKINSLCYSVFGIRLWSKSDLSKNSGPEHHQYTSIHFGDIDENIKSKIGANAL